MAHLAHAGRIFAVNAAQDPLAWKGLLAGSGVVGFWARSLLRRVIAVGGSGTTPPCPGWASCSYRVSRFEHGLAKAQASCRRHVHVARSVPERDWQELVTRLKFMRGGVLRSAPPRRAPPLADGACVGANLQTRTWVRTLGAGDPGPSWWPGSGFVLPVTHLLHPSDLHGLSKSQTTLRRCCLRCRLPVAWHRVYTTHTHTYTNTQHC